MQITFDIPDDIAATLGAEGSDASRAALEAIAVEGYRTQRLTEGQIKRMLGYGTRMQVHALLAEHGVPLHYTEEMLRQDIEASDQMFAMRKAQALAAR